MTKKTFQNNNPANPQYDKANSAENLVNPIQIYHEWLKNHKKKNAVAQGNDAEVSMNEEGTGCNLNFKDPQDEEDFLRHLAKHTNGTVYEHGEVIAKLKGGKLIDPRTDKEFAPGAYTARIEELKAHNKSVPNQTIPSNQEDSSLSMGMPDDSTYNFAETMNDLNDLNFQTLDHKNHVHEEASIAPVNSL